MLALLLFACALATRHLTMEGTLPAVTIVLLVLAVTFVCGLAGLLLFEKYKFGEEQKFKKIHDRFDLVSQLANDSILLFDDHLNIIEVNHKACETYGYTMPEMLKLTLVDLRADYDRKNVDEMLEQLRQKKSLIYEVEQKRKDGTTFPIEVSIAQCEWEGRVFYQGIARDIEHRKKSEAQLRENRALLASIVDGTPDGIFAKDLTGRYILMNHALRKMLHIEGEAIPHVRDSDVFPREAASISEIDEEIIATKSVKQFEERISMNDGRSISFLTVKGPIQDNNGNVVGLFGIARDITDRKKVEERLRTLQRAVDQSPACILVTDVNGIIEYVNERFTTVTGWTREEVIGKTPRIFTSGLTPPGTYKTLWETILSGKEWHGELKNKKKNGQLFVEDISISPMRDSDGKITHFVAVKEDITTKKSLEEQLLRAQRLESIGQLAGGIAHDLNNVLAPIAVSVELLQERAQDELTRDLLTTLEKSVLRGKDIISQVLSFARGHETEKIIFHPVHILDEITNIARETFPRSIQINTSFEPGLQHLLGDVTQIHQILMNLCLNAKDAMEHGGRLDLRAKNIYLNEHTAASRYGARAGKYVVLSVCDTGIGIKAEDLNRIFDPFFTTKPPGAGTGLGLSTVFRIVRNHDGFIDIQSRPGVGSAFHVYLPASDRIQSEQNLSSSEIPRGHGEGILVIDDESAIRNVVRQILFSFGYRPFVAENGAEAIELYKRNQNAIQVVIADWMMPGMNGAETIRQLRLMNENLKALVSTGLLDDSETGPTRIPGVYKTLLKPYTATALLQSIRQVLIQNEYS